jgi:hypothetical protein
MAIAETHLRLGRVHIDIDLIGRHFQKEKSRRITAGHDQAAIGLPKGVQQAAVADPAAIEEEILHAGVAAIAGRVGEVAEQAGRPLPDIEGKEPVAHLGAEEQADALQ